MKLTPGRRACDEVKRAGFIWDHNTRPHACMRKAAISKYSMDQRVCMEPSGMDQAPSTPQVYPKLCVMCAPCRSRLMAPHTLSSLMSRCTMGGEKSCR